VIGRVLLILVLQTIVLGGMVGMKQWTLATGTPVLLKTEPIDPRSLFRGDYVQLNYAISRLELDDVGGDAAFARHDPIYVVLRQGEQYWEPRAVHRAYPPASEDEVVIRGEVTDIFELMLDPSTGESRTGTSVFVRYGIENYFVPEGEGRALERPDAGVIDIQVVVDSAGNAAIKQVLVDGEVRYEETLL